jgi:hypothetical protein
VTGILALRYKFFAEAANFIHQTNFCDCQTLKKVLLNLKDCVPLNLKIKYLRFYVKEGLLIGTTFNHLSFRRTIPLNNTSVWDSQDMVTISTVFVGLYL